MSFKWDKRITNVLVDRKETTEQDQQKYYKRIGRQKRKDQLTVTYDRNSGGCRGSKCVGVEEELISMWFSNASNDVRSLRNSCSVYSTTVWPRKGAEDRGIGLEDKDSKVQRFKGSKVQNTKTKDSEYTKTKGLEYRNKGCRIQRQKVQNTTEAKGPDYKDKVFRIHNDKRCGIQRHRCNTKEYLPREEKSKAREEWRTHKLPTTLGTDGPNACTHNAAPHCFQWTECPATNVNK